MKRTFLYGIFAAFVLIVVVKGGGMLLSKKGNEETAPELTLLEINFVRDTDNKDLISTLITKHSDPKEEIRLPNLKGKPVIVHFWATWCNPCIRELPHYNSFVKEHPEIVHIPLTPDGTTADKISAFYAQNSLKSLPIVTDDKGAVARYFEVKSFPTTLFINKEGKVVGRIIGIIDWNDKATTDLLLKTFAA